MAVRDAYVGAVTPQKLDAALVGLNDLLAAAFSGKSPPGGSSFAAGTTAVFPPGFSFPSLVTPQTTLDASADGDLGSPGAPLVLDAAQLNVLASFTSNRAVTIGTGQAIINTNAFTLGLTGNLTANGTLIKEGAGVLELTGNNTWAAAPLIVDGTLRGNSLSLATDITTGNLSFTVPGSPVLEFNQAIDGTYAGNVSGDRGSFVKNGAGTLTLSGVNSLGARIDAGRIELAATGRLGGGSLALAAGTELDISGARGANGASVGMNFARLSGQGSITLGSNSLGVGNSTDATFAGNISGTGSFSVGFPARFSPKTLTLTGVNTYTGITGIGSGVLALSDAGTISALSTVSLSGATFDISAADGDRTVGGLIGGGRVLLGANRLTLGGNDSDGFYDGDIAGSGGITKVGSGKQYFQGGASYTGETQILGGIVVANPHALSASILNNTELEFTYGKQDPSGSPIIDYTGEIRGSGKLIKSGDGVVWLRGTNSYAGGTEVRDGALVGNTQSLQGNISNHAILAFYQIDDGDYGGVVSGDGVLLKYGPGRVTLDGINLHSGSTAFSGPLRVNSDANLGAPTAPLIAVDGTLELAGNTNTMRPVEWIGHNTLNTNGFDFSAAGNMTGNGALTKIGSGALNLAGDNAFTGMLRIAEGSLRLNGKLGGAVEIAAGATLAGSGSIGGSLSFAPGSVYAVEARPNGTSTSFQLGSNASASVSGGNVMVSAADGNYEARTRYTIISAPGGVAGQFESATTNLAFFDAVLSYDPTVVYLTLARKGIGFADLAGAGQRELARALDSLDGNTSADGIATNSALRALTVDEIPVALRQISGAALPTIPAAHKAQQHLISRQIGGRLSGVARGFNAADADAMSFDHEPLLAASDADATLPVLVAALSAVTAHTAATGISEQGFWLRGLAGRGDFDVVDTDGMDTHTTGVLAGYDRVLNPNLILGSYLGFTDSSMRVRDLTLSSDGSLESWRFGLYGRWQQGPTYLDAQLAYSRDRSETARLIDVGTLTRTAHADFDGDSYDANVELGYALGGRVKWEPFVGVEWNRQSTDSYRESGAGVLNLAMAAHTDDAVRSRLGARVRVAPRESPSGLSLELSGAWAHEYTDVSRFGARLAGDGTQTLFTINGTDARRDSAEVGASLAGRVGKNTRAFLAFDSEINGADQTYTVSAGIRMSW